MKNELKAKLKKGEVALGTTITIGHPDISETLGKLGYDWILIDTEHAPLEVGMIQLLLQAMSASRSVPIVRVAWNDLVLVKRALDIGAYGVIIPWVNSREEAARAVQAVRYPPAGLRGYGPRRASLIDDEYFETADREVFLGIQIETQKAVDNLDEIFAVPGIDAILVGPADLSLSLGILKRYDHPKFVSTMQRIADAAKKHGVVAGMLAVDDVSKRAAQGFQLLNISADIAFLRDGAATALSNGRKAINP